MDQTIAQTGPEALSEAQARQELARLAALLAAADLAYHRDDAPVMSDADYDALKRRNAAIELRFPALVVANGPSGKVGAQAADGFGKIAHRVRMRWNISEGWPAR